MEAKACFSITQDGKRKLIRDQNNCSLASLSHSLALTLCIHVVSSLYLSDVGLIFLFSENQHDSKWPPHIGSLCLGICIASGKTTEEAN